MFDWDDLRHFLAVARGGSTLAASRTLKLSQPTVVRRIAALEDRLGVRLFDRSRRGYDLTEQGQALVKRAEAIERSMADFGDAAVTQSRQLSGTVRLSIFEIFMSVFAPLIRDFTREFPGIRIDLDCSDELRDLASGEADIAFRSAVQLSGDDLVCRRVGADYWTFYCSRAFAAEHGVPDTLEKLRSHPIIGEFGSNFWPEYDEWLRRSGLANSVDLHHGSATGLLAAVRGGFGVALLPHLVAGNDPDLVRCFGPPRLTDHSLWLVTHERLRDNPRVRVVIDFLADGLKSKVLTASRKLEKANEVRGTAGPPRLPRRSQTKRPSVTKDFVPPNRGQGRAS